MKKMRLLILEDSPDDAAFMEVTLKRAGLDLNIKIVSSRPEYIKALDSFVPEFILSDHQLPDFISTEALAIARKKYPGVPFILVTGTVSEEFAVEILKAGADDYMLKDRMSRLPLAMEMALKKRKALKELSDYKYALDEFAIVAITDQKGIITYANQNFCKISKYDPEELIGQDHRIINSGIHPASYIKELWVTIANGKIWHGEFCNRAKDGSLYWVDTSIIPFLDAQGKPYQYLSIRMDITERKKIQEQLFEREEQLELFIKHSPAALAMLDNEMRYIALSERWIRDYKLDNIELAGASHYGIFPGLPQRWKDIHKRCLAGAIEKSEEDYMINADGSKSWLRWEVHPWRKAWGEIGGIIIFSEDITERKKAVEEILQIQMRLKQAQEIAHLGNWAVNFTNNTSYWSDEAYQIYGVEPGNHNFSIEDWLSFVHPDDLHFVKQKIEESMATYSDYGFDHRIIRKDGSVRHIYSESKFEFNLNGEPVGLYGIAHDITQSKKDEEELKKSERRLKEAQSVAHLGNWEIDLVRNTHTWSDETYKIFGLEEQAVQPSIALFLSFINPEDLDFAKQKIAAAFETAEDSSFEFRFIKKDGAVRHGYMIWKFDYDLQAKPLRLFGILQDITERKEAEINLRAMEERILEQKIQEQKEIAKAIITGQEIERNHIGRELHDNINQILAGTKMFLGTAAKKNVEVGKIIRYPMELIDTSIEEIRILCSRLVTPIKNIDLEDQVRDLLLKLDMTAEIKTKFIYGVPPALLPDDLKLNIYRILQEQVNNIIKYAEAKNVTVKIIADGKNIDITTTDDGKGFDVNAKRVGIGISNMINRAEMFNGEAHVNSRPGNGCEIRITIPY